MDVRAAFVVLLGLALDASAATNSFTAVGPTGGSVRRIVYSRDGTGAFMAATGGFYRSLDAGVTWKNIKSDFENAPFDVAIDPADPSRVYVVASNAPYLYVSSDGGATVTASTTLPVAVSQARNLAVSHDGATLYLSSNGQIFRSADRGQTWQERTALSLDATTQVVRLVVDPGDPATLYAAAYTGTTDNAGISVSRDGAATWQQVTSGTEEASLTSDLAIDPANPAKVWSAQYDGVWVSPDRGLHWSNVLSTAMSAVAIDPTDSAVIYAASPYGKVYRSANAGTTWSDVSGNNTAGENPLVAINPSHPTQLLVGGNAGVSGSTSSGGSWTAQQTGFMATRVDGLSADPSADRIYIHARSNGVFYTAGGGAVAQPVNNAGLLALEPPLPNIDVTAILAQPGRLFASVASGLTDSTDGGTTWSPTTAVLPTLPGTQQLWMLSSAPGTPQTILTTTYGPVFRSVDQGVTWSQVVNGVPANSIAWNLLYAPSHPATAYGTFYRDTNPTTLLGVYTSVDAGVSWAPVNTNLSASPTYLVAVDPQDASVAYGNNINAYSSPVASLLKTVDGGAHWSALGWDSASSNGAPNRLAIDPVHPNILYAASYGRVARSVDGGVSWETLRGQIQPLWLVSALLADPLRPENLLVATDSASVQQITIAPDLMLGVTGPAAQIGIGTPVTFNYTATNLGPFDATGVKVTVQLPAGAQGVTAAVGSGTGTCTVTAPVASCTFPVLRKAAAGAITVTAIAPSAGIFALAASVSGEQPDADPSSNTVSSSTTATTLSDLSVTATGSASATVGDAVSYTLVATNGGPNDAPSAQLTFQMAAGLTPGTVSSSDATCTTAAALTTCDLGLLAVARTATVTVTATAASAGAQASTASVSSGATDPAAANNSASATTTVNAAAPASTRARGGGGTVSSGELVALLWLLVARHARGLFRRDGML